MSSPSLLGFCGPAGAGKTTAACSIVGHFPGWHRVSFADPLRAMLGALGLTADELTLRKEEPCPLLGGKTPRHALQTLGTEWGRGQIDESLWLRAATYRARALLQEGHSVVFDDVRFDNEARMIRELGGQVVSVGRPGVSANPAHASERGISPELVSRHLVARDVLALRSAVFALINPPPPDQPLVCTCGSPMYRDGEAWHCTARPCPAASPAYVRDGRARIS